MRPIVVEPPGSVPEDLPRFRRLPLAAVASGPVVIVAVLPVTIIVSVVAAALMAVLVATVGFAERTALLELAFLALRAIGVVIACKAGPCARRRLTCGELGRAETGFATALCD
ncbi:MAG: hypothetical protein ACN4G0_15775 [Polyangiales bacterium]